MLAGLVAAMLIVPAVSLWRETTAHEWRVLGLGTLARIKLFVGFSAGSDQVYEWNEGQIRPMPLAVVAGDPMIDWTRARFLHIAGANALLGLRIGVGGAALGLSLLAFSLWRKERPALLQHSETKASKQLRRFFERPPGWFANLPFPGMRRQACRIGGVSYPEGAETRHTIVSGATGSGRAELISDLIGQGNGIWGLWARRRRRPGLRRSSPCVRTTRSHRRAAPSGPRGSPARE